MASLKVLDKAGKSVGEVKLGDRVADATVNTPLLHRAVVSEEANNRQGTQKAKTRAEVRGGGRKPYRQKKTGRARQGTVSAPHYHHGGVAFAPVPRDYSKKVNRKERRKAIITALSARVTSGDVIVVDKIEFKKPKTKDAIAMLKAVGAGDAKRVLVILESCDDAAYKSFRNIPNIKIRTAPVRGEGSAQTQGFSTRDLLVAHKIVAAKGAIEAIEEAWA